MELTKVQHQPWILDSLKFKLWSSDFSLESLYWGKIIITGCC